MSITNNLSLNELSVDGQLTTITGDAITAITSDLLSGNYVYCNSPTPFANYDQPIYGYGQPLCIDSNGDITQIAETVAETVHKTIYNKIVNEPEIPKWTGFIEI